MPPSSSAFRENTAFLLLQESYSGIVVPIWLKMIFLVMNGMKLCLTEPRDKKAYLTKAGEVHLSL